MPTVVWLVLAVLVAVLLTSWVTFTITRLDRLHARVDAAQAALDAQLVRRDAALLHVAETPTGGLPPAERTRLAELAGSALAARDVDGLGREGVENQVGRALLDLLEADGPTLAADADAELREAAARVQIARRFYNDAVRDTRSLRGRRLPRLLRLAGRRDLPDFFDIDDSVPAAPRRNHP
ncbi:MAG: hypothetical protein ACTHMS_08515 [Jatrophihabitans sp.]|uniref:hypothetical protein n=1 Tax=Jatrophihabitans sp. TaxID=1932789 RepID=UPI003F7E4276